MTREEQALMDQLRREARTLQGTIWKLEARNKMLENDLKAMEEHEALLRQGVASREAEVQELEDVLGRIAEGGAVRARAMHAVRLRQRHLRNGGSEADAPPAPG